MNSLVSPKFIVTQRSVREHLAVLQKKYQKKMRQEEKASGISPEKTELDILLEERTSKSIKEEKEKKPKRKRRSGGEMVDYLKKKFVSEQK
ncbi:Hypothetical predicted protein, partial [Paramuricea clavata]